jgi:DNA-binding SARP family transcriptional activator
LIRITMRFLVLGPLEVVSGDRGSLPLGGRKQRRLLALLLLHANRVVERDQLMESAWGNGPPPSARESLDAYVYRLRQLLGHDRIARQDGGYVLRIERGERDVDDFEQLVARASEAT